jgi:hypothetical protein
MRLYISNFDLAPLAKAVAAAVLLIAAVWLVFPSHFVSDEIPVGSAETFNELILEQYTYEYSHKPIVLVGSSIQTYVPSFDCRPNNVASIYLQGRSGITGLAAITKLGAKPEVVFVETSTLILPIDQQLMDVVFRPIYWRIRTLVPPLRSTRNWLVLLAQKFVYDRNLYVWLKRPAPMELDLPSQSVSQWNDERGIPQILANESRKTYVGNDESVRALRQLVSLVRTLQQRGVRVIFFEPSDPRFAAFSTMKEVRESVHAALPDIEYIVAPDDKLPLYRWEGYHIHEASGVLLFNYLMEKAGLPERALCKVRPRLFQAGQ